MDIKEATIVDVLKDLAQLDIDAVYAYEQALKQIDDSEIYQTIDGFRNDHIRHIEELSAELSKLGEEAPERTKDFKGFIIQGFTAIRSMTGTRGALSAMEGNEKTTNKNYKSAIQDNPTLPPKILALLNKNYNDEQRHLAYIQTTLKEWDSKYSS